MQKLSNNSDGIKIAANELKHGNIVAIPTETVYGLAANALDSNAVEKIFKAKGRPSDNPLIVHIAEISDMEKYAEVTALAYTLAKKFWPGPLTMILPKKECIPKEVTANLQTVAIRMPQHETAREIIRECGFPIAAPSANISGRPSPTSAQHVEDDFKDNPFVTAVVDGGKCRCGVESTVLSLCGEVPCLLRPGFITAEMLKEIIPNLKIAEAVLNELPANETVLSPGLKHKHYSPIARTICIKGLSANAAKYVRSDGNIKKTVICFHNEERLFENCTIIPYGKESDFEELAENLFRALREADKTNSDKIYVRIPEIDETSVNGVLLAVYNRLLRAANFTVIDCNLAANGTVIGVTGPSGAGKGTVCRILEKYGYIHIDTDKIWHKIINKKVSELTKAFGNISDQNGNVDRKKLAEKAFSSESNLNKLNKIAHVAIMEKASEIIDENRSDGKFKFSIDGAAIFEAEANKICNKIIAVTACETERVKRVKLRDQIDETLIKQRFERQKPNDFYTQNADYTVINNDNPENLEQKIKTILHEIEK